MEYHWAAKLKEAGFPQNATMIVGRWQDKHGKYSKVPTLSEIIEAIDGMDFELNYNKGKGWTACSEMQRGVGRSPEEAVSNLWIELNKK